MCGWLESTSQSCLHQVGRFNSESFKNYAELVNISSMPSAWVFWSWYSARVLVFGGFVLVSRKSNSLLLQESHQP